MGKKWPAGKLKHEGQRVTFIHMGSYVDNPADPSSHFWVKSYSVMDTFSEEFSALSRTLTLGRQYGISEFKLRALERACQHLQIQMVDEAAKQKIRIKEHAMKKSTDQEDAKGETKNNDDDTLQMLLELSQGNWDGDNSECCVMHPESSVLCPDARCSS